MRPGQIVFTYFHFAADEQLTRAVMAVGHHRHRLRDDPATRKGTLPLLTPMSEVAGRMSIQEGAKYLERPFEGRGILLGGVPGVPPAERGRSSAAASSARTPPRSPPGWGPTSPSSTSTSTACATSTT